MQTKDMWNIDQLKATALGIAALGTIILGKITIADVKIWVGLLTSGLGVLVAIAALVNYGYQIRKSHLEIKKLTGDELAVKKKKHRIFSIKK